MRLMIKLDLRPSENRLSRAWCSFWMSNEQRFFERVHVLRGHPYREFRLLYHNDRQCGGTYDLSDCSRL